MRAELSGLVRRASELTAEAAGLGADRVFPVLPELRDLLPGRGLRRGSTMAVLPNPEVSGSTSLLLALLAAGSQAGSWCAVVGMPQLGLVAASEWGIALDRLALVPNPGAQWTTVVSALIDGFDLVVLAPGAAVAPAIRGQLAARVRHRGSVLICFGGWEGADVVMTPESSVWHGLERGRGRLRGRELTVSVRGRGAAGRPRHGTLWLPEPLPGALPTPPPGLATPKRPTLASVPTLAGVPTPAPESAASNAANGAANNAGNNAGNSAANNAGNSAGNSAGNNAGNSAGNSAAGNAREGAAGNAREGAAGYEHESAAEYAHESAAESPSALRRFTVVRNA